MTEIRSYRDLNAWKLGVSLCRRVYELTADFPDAERFGLTGQLRRSVISIPSNIAEGWGRGSTPEYLRFLRVARGSLFEVETQLLIARELRMVDGDAIDLVQEQGAECGRVLSGLIKSIESKLRVAAADPELIPDP